MPAEIGRRERKKAETRRTIADAALRLFLERGYDAVGVREIAEEADVATATLFAHFPSKEALVFDRDEELEAQLLDVVRARPAGTDIPEAFRRWYLAAVDEAARTPGLDRYHQLIATTPALRDYENRMWLRHEDTVAAAVADDLGRAEPDATIQFFATCLLQVLPTIRRQIDQKQAVDSIFDFLDAGWAAVRGSERLG